MLDVNYGVIEDLEGLAARMSMIPGVVEHGIFDNLDELYLAREDGVEIVRRKSKQGAVPEDWALAKIIQRSISL